MRLSLNGRKVGWLDRDQGASAWALKRACTNGSKFDVIAVDDADTLGHDLAATLREVCSEKPHPLIIISIRSGRIDRVLNPAQLGKTPIAEEVMPLLTNTDIAGLIDALTNDNKLGKLRGLSRSVQEQIFREKAGRELLVAMIEATSGERFEDKAVREFDELESSKRKIYAFVATATAQDFPLDKTSLLLALGANNSNDTLNALEELVRRNILVLQPDLQRYRSRHRVLGELIQRSLQNSGQLYEVLRGLLLVLAAHVYPEMKSHAQPRRLLTRMVNHKFLHQLLGPEHARRLYEDLEDSLKNEAHYWLQRGVMDLETGNLRLAKNWLDQAKGINPSDDYVETAFAHWQFRTAIETPQDPKSPAMVIDAVESLDHQIKINGNRQVHAYHVLGSQTIAWIRRSFLDFEEKRDLLLHAIDQVRDGVLRHPKHETMNRLFKDLENEKLNLVMR
jgi:tetratricopeptide (TPR) repeat protein